MPTEADIIVTPGNAPADAAWAERINSGTILILEGASPLAESFGFHATSQKIPVRSVMDLRSPKLEMVWEEQVVVPRFKIPVNAKVFTQERWSKEPVPLMAGFRQGDGAVLWLATDLGRRGYSRYPYLPQALADLGFEPPFHASNLWAFFDSSYRTRADLEYLAPRWRKAGIAALHVAAWHYWEPDAARDEYLRRLILACHRNAIQVYAWVELPHVSEKFWADHPAWREKTALGQDAQLDWRKLINLTNRDAFAAVALGLREVLTRFDWDGVNLAELYFESLEGIQNPARFTPMNDDVRREFHAATGLDVPALAGGVASADLTRFLEFRAELARKQQTEWIEQIETLRRGRGAPKPWLDLVLTHVDDRLDTSMRDKIGADASKTLPLLKQHDFTFLVEDPATLWDLGPQRYPQIASRYADITPRPEKLAIDINVVERYQDVYPTKLQTGSELFQLLHVAAEAFPRTALYFENSILPVDFPWLATAAAQVDLAESTGSSLRAERRLAAEALASNTSSPNRDASASSNPAAGSGIGADVQGRGALERQSPRLRVSSRRGLGVAWPIAPEMPGVLVDGQVWPIGNDTITQLPAGTHVIATAPRRPAMRILDLNADLRAAQATPNGVEFIYESSARAMAVVEGGFASMAIDGVAASPAWADPSGPNGSPTVGNVLLLPPGQHMVTLTRALP